MRVGLVRVAMAAGIAAGGAASAPARQLPPLPSPVVGQAAPAHRPTMPQPPIVSRPEIPAPLGVPEAYSPPEVHLPELHPPEEHEHEHEHERLRHHQKNHEPWHCMPGVYRTEIERFRGNGFVARKDPFTVDRYTMERAGFPKERSHLAEPSHGPHYTGYYVGGGASLFKKHAFAHRRQEGTWGWDYEHLGLKRRVQLLFSRGALYQDGDGQYETDPPFEITNVFAIRYGERLHRLFGHEGEGEGE